MRRNVLIKDRTQSINIYLSFSQSHQQNRLTNLSEYINFLN